MSSQDAQTSLVLTRRLADGTVEWIPFAIPDRIVVGPGEHYALVDRTHSEAPPTLVARRQGEDLALEVDGTEVLVLDRFFVTEDVAFYPTTDIAGGGGPFAGAPLTPDSQVLAGSPGGEQVVWSAEPVEVTDRGDEPASADGGSPLLWGGLAAGGLGLALAGAGGGGGGGGGNGGGSVDPEPVQTTIEGTVLAGPAIDGNGMSVELFEADGTTELGTGKVAADGSFSVDIGDYTGVVIVRVVDADPGEDYQDEATGDDKDLNADLSAAIASSETDTTVFVNVNPLTTLAAALAEREADGAAPTPDQVARSNAAIAELFGFDDLHGTTPEPINGGAYDADDGLSAGERYGAVLAAFSGADLNNGGNSQQTIDDVLAGISLSGSEAVLSSSAQAVLLEGAETIESETGESLGDAISSLVDPLAPQITSGATASAIDENSGADQLVYTATAADGADVTWSLAAGGDAADFSIDADTGEVTLTADPDHETNSSYSFTVVATDEDGNSAQQAVSLPINDLDEVAPAITSGDTAPAIDENSGAGQVVYTVTSTDDGDVSTGSTTYSLGPRGDADAFGIDPETGTVTLIDDPDFEAKSSYSFTVVATDAAGNSSEQAVTLTINDLDDDQDAPTVESVALSGASGAENGILNAGDTVTVTVTMSENTEVDTSGGTPRIALALGGETVFASYASGSGSTSLIFQYTIVPGDDDSDGISIPANALETNGSSLADASGNEADLSHASVDSDPSFAVDTSAPTLSSSTPEDDAEEVPVDADIVLTFSEDVQIGSGTITISGSGDEDTRTIDVTDSSQVSIDGNQVTINPAEDLNPDRNYRVQIDEGAFTDAAGNAYAGISNSSTLNFETDDTDTSIVVFDLVQGSSSNHSGRTFENDVSYTIYIRVESDDSDVSTSGGGPGTWGTWSGAENLGSDDRVILVGDGDNVEGPFGLEVNGVSVNSASIAWSSTAFGVNAAVLQDRSFIRITGFDNDEADGAFLFDTSLPPGFLGGQGGELNTMYRTSMPAGILTSQGLV